VQAGHRFSPVASFEYFLRGHQASLLFFVVPASGMGVYRESYFMGALEESTLMNAKEAKEVMQTALGRQKADLAIVNVTLANVYTGELLDDSAVAVKGKWIAYVGGDVQDNIGAETVVIDAEGKTLIPGFIEGHTHLAQMYDAAEFTRYALKGGTTTIITETTEVFPMGDYEGVVDFLESYRQQPLKIYGTTPVMASISSACKTISLKTLQKLLDREDILGMGESYWQAVLQDPDRFLPLYEETLRRKKTCEGHSAGARGRKLMAYTAMGISSCHEPITADEVLERLRLGIYVMIREGSIRRELEAVSQLKDREVDLRRLILVTDGVDPHDLLEKGYMEYIVQKAIDLGFNPMDALRMATLNVAEHFSLDGIIGGIAPGRYADMAIIPDMKTIRPEYVISHGQVVVKNGELTVQPRKPVYRDASCNSIHISGSVKPEDFVLAVDRGAASVRVRVMDMITDLVTKEWITDMPVADGKITVDLNRDIIKVAAIDRTHRPAKKYVGLIRGFHIKAGAFATSTPWDTADIVVVGADDADIALAVNRIIALKGGFTVSKNGKITAEFALPIFGIISDQPMEILARSLEKINNAAADLGVSFPKPFLSLQILTTSAIPYVRICEEGLVNLKDGQTVGLIAE
jgi:adenine deaminase